MGKVQDYLKAKEELNLPVGYFFKSDRNGVSEIFDVKYSQTGSLVTFIIPNKELTFTEMLQDSLYFEEFGGSGFGDTWSFSYFFSISKEIIEFEYKKEIERLEENYFIHLDWSKITNDESTRYKIIELLKLERQIKAVDENALINLQLELLTK